jgi:hypothetical protein
MLMSRHHPALVAEGPGDLALPLHRAPGLGSRLRAHLDAQRLDAALAAGADPMASPDLTARAELLLRPRTRRALAHGLRRAAADASRTRMAISAAVHVARPDVHENARPLLALAAELLDPCVRPGGIALTRRLLCDGAGPLYAPSGAGELRDAIEEARAAL